MGHPAGESDDESLRVDFDRRLNSYPVGWNAFKRLAAGASAVEKTDLFWRTAARVYRLDTTLFG